MQPVKPEFHRPFAVDRIPPGGCTEKIKADAEECQNLAQRFDLSEVKDFRALLRLAPWRGGGVKITGQIDASIVQLSVVSLEPFASDERFEVEEYFLPEGKAVSEDDDADVIVNGEIDLGEVAAEVFALELDPYPRKPGEEFAGYEATSQASLHPFGALAKALKPDGK